MRTAKFVAAWRLRRGGRLVFAEKFASSATSAKNLGLPAIAKGGVAIGTALIVPGDEGAVERDKRVTKSPVGEVVISHGIDFGMARFLCRKMRRGCARRS